MSAMAVSRKTAPRALYRPAPTPSPTILQFPVSLPTGRAMGWQRTVSLSISPGSLAMSHARPRLRPRLETLQARWCPSCTVRQDGDTLVITGDRGDNRIEMVQVDATGLRVACDGGPAQSFRGVARVTVSTLAGNDAVRYLLGGPDTLPVDLRVDLGADNDSFT